MRHPLVGPHPVLYQYRSGRSSGTVRRTTVVSRARVRRRRSQIDRPVGQLPQPVTVALVDPVGQHRGPVAGAGRGTVRAVRTVQFASLRDSRLVGRPGEQRSRPRVDRARWCSWAGARGGCRQVLRPCAFRAPARRPSMSVPLAIDGGRIVDPFHRPQSTTAAPCRPRGGGAGEDPYPDGSSGASVSRCSADPACREPPWAVDAEPGAARRPRGRRGFTTAPRCRSGAHRPTTPALRMKRRRPNEVGSRSIGDVSGSQAAGPWPPLS
jgi:hypothetical protein